MASPSYDLNAVRALFPVVEQVAYLDHAATGTLSRPVREAMTAYLEARQTPAAWETYKGVIADLRAALARLIHASPEEIALVQNTTEGLNLVAHMLPLEPGDNVILCDVEFPSNVFPWKNLGRRGVEARIVPNEGGGLTVDLLERYANARTRAVTTSSVQFLTGFRTDLEAIGTWCREHGVYFVVDAIQSLGVIPLDVQATPVDFLACGGVKWLLGPAGQGFLYVRRELLERLPPPFAGPVSVGGERNSWLNYDLTFLPHAQRLELGTYNYAGIVGLLTAVRFLLETGVEAIEAWTHHLTEMLIEDLKRRGYRILSNREPRRRSAIVTFRPAGDPKAAWERLRTAGVVLSLREGYLRVSPHGYNTEDEILQVSAVLGNA